MDNLNHLNEPKFIGSIDADSQAAPDGHSAKVDRLISTLEQRNDLRISKTSWASGIILATKI